MYKSFKTISLDITEAQYREDGAMHYSTLATYARGGFGCLETLFDRKESPSLVFGSCVDSLLTGGQEEFDCLFYPTELPAMSPALVQIVNDLFNIYGGSVRNISELPVKVLAEYWDKYDGRNWKAETKAKAIIEGGFEYYRQKFIAGNRTIISNELYSEVIQTVSALKESESTKDYFADDDPFDCSVERLYQLKFSGYVDLYGNVVPIKNIEDIEDIKAKGFIAYSCMADLIKVDHANKIVYPCDLKTSSHTEYDFYKSFIDWSYHIQARLYWRLIRAAMDADEHFKDYELADYTFIVANKKTLNPLTWSFPDTKMYGELTYGENGQIKCADPFSLGAELNHYLSSRPTVPDGISLTAPNNLVKWLNKM